MIQQAIGAVENALLDLKARALGVPVYELLGYPVRDRIRLYWSHCGTYRLAWSKEMQIPRLRNLQDVVNAGKEVVARGFTALKTNVFVLGADPYLHSPGFARRGPGYPELNADRHVLRAIRDELAAFREGAGPDVDLLVDLNFNFKTEGCECLFGRRDYRPFFEAQAVDVAIIDTPWNGVAESAKIAAMADTYEVNVAPHNFYGHLATLMNAHFAVLAHPPRKR